jgi:hypothetical protein
MAILRCPGAQGGGEASSAALAYAGERDGQPRTEEASMSKRFRLRKHHPRGKAEGKQRTPPRSRARENWLLFPAGPRLAKPWLYGVASRAAAVRAG